MRPSRPDHVVAFGIFLATLAAYVATSPGRIDIVDGQSRYEAAVNWLELGRPYLFDPIIAPFMAVPGRDGLPYSYYGAAGSLVGMPLVGLGLLAGGSSAELARFLFTLTTPIFGALIAALLFTFYRRLAVPPRAALAWTCVTAFATLLWPGSLTSFDNAQHAFFVLAAVYLGYLSAARRSVALAAAAGVVAGVLILYQEYFALVIPALAVATLDVSIRDGRIRLADPRASGLRFLTFGAVSVSGLILALAYNDWRFGSWFENGKLYYFPAEDSVLGNPVSGLLTLLVSPGKSIFLYSPPVVLAAVGFMRLWRERTPVALTIVAASTIMVLFYSSFRFVGGDWCWGPRYVLVVLPLWALAFPFVLPRTSLRRCAMIAIVGAGFAVQLLAIGGEHQRFFFARGLQDAFWEDAWVYFKQSALFARPGELIALGDGSPASARWFTTVPLPGYTTYAILGPPPTMPRNLAPQWMRQYQVFYLPRPWPFWMSSIEPEARPVNMSLWLGGVLAIGAIGVVQIRTGLRQAT